MTLCKSAVASARSASGRARTALLAPANSARSTYPRCPHGSPTRVAWHPPAAAMSFCRHLVEDEGKKQKEGKKKWPRLMSRGTLVALVLGVSCMRCSALVRPNAASSLAPAPQLRLGAAGIQLQRVAHVEREVCSHLLSLRGFVGCEMLSRGRRVRVCLQDAIFYG